MRHFCRRPVRASAPQPSVVPVLPAQGQDVDALEDARNFSQTTKSTSKISAGHTVRQVCEAIAQHAIHTRTWYTVYVGSYPYRATVRYTG